MECYAARVAFLVNKSQNCYLEIARVRNRARDQIEHTTKHENHVQSYLGKLLVFTGSVKPVTSPFSRSLRTVPKGNQALQRRLPVSLTIYNSDYKQLAEFDVIEYSAQDNNGKKSQTSTLAFLRFNYSPLYSNLLSVDGLYDVSECYSTNKTLLIQFRLSIPYEKVHEFGVGSFVQVGWS